jgi:phosphopantetheinyl transferase
MRTAPVTEVGKQFVSLHHVAVPAQPWPSLESALLPRLPQRKRESIERLRMATDRNASMLALLLLEAGCRTHGWGPPLERLDYPPKGKPTLVGGPFFSISHTRGRAGVAICRDRDVGFDLERAHAASTAALRLTLGSPAREWLLDGRVDPTRLWVSTEAVLKGAGLGVSSASLIRFRTPQEATVADRHWHLTNVDLDVSYVGALACEGAPAEVGIHEHLPAVLAGLPFDP